MCPTTVWFLIQKQGVLSGLRKRGPACCSVDQKSFSDESQSLPFSFKSRSQKLEAVWRGTESKLLKVQRDVSTVSGDLGSHVFLLMLVYCIWSSWMPSTRKLYSTPYFLLLTIFMEILISFTVGLVHIAKKQQKNKKPHQNLVYRICGVSSSWTPDPTMHISWKSMLK